jgi:tripartite ATP-independent transporter DctM subunit
MPFFAAMGCTGLFFGLAFWGIKVTAIGDMRVYGFLLEPSFMAIPMFVLLGTVMGSTGIAENLFMGIYKFFGPVRGGLFVAVGMVCTLMAATTGIAAGPVATMGLTALPIMLKQKYEPGMACACISASATLGTLIPPSTLLIIYGMQADMSIGQLYFAAFLPGFMLSGLFMVYYIVKPLVSPYDAPAVPVEERELDLRKSLIQVTVNVVPVLGLIFAVLGTIYTGICTPTEGAGVGAFLACILAVIYKKFTWRIFTTAVTNCYRATAMMGGILIGANFFSSVFLAAGGGSTVTNIALNLGLGPGGVIFVCLFLNFLMGFVLNNLTIVLVLIPIFQPVLRKMGVDDLWFAMLFTFMGQIAYLTPPFAPGVYLLKPLTPPEIELASMYRGIIPFVIIDIIGAVIIYFFPIIATWLPSQMIKQ